uniref:Uncharacterized protein n=1 Tax=Anguilla anguilla TaxID=7936 RepID=A0A0E9WVD7_ANGAN
MRGTHFFLFYSEFIHVSGSESSIFCSCYNLKTDFYNSNFSNIKKVEHHCMELH